MARGSGRTSIITALRDTDGKLIGFAKVTRDLTERRRHEEILRHSEARFRALVEGVRDYAIFMLDPDGRVATWNAGAEQILGYDASEIIGEHFSTFYPAGRHASASCAEHELQTATIDGRFEDEGWRVRKDGTRFWANVVLTAIRDANGKLLGLLEDHARSHRAPRTRKRSCARARSASACWSRA